jgi:hypothetical protein
MTKKVSDRPPPIPPKSLLTVPEVTVCGTDR